jgi:hypothetical protein
MTLTRVMFFEETALEVPVLDGATVDVRVIVDEGLLDIVEEVKWRSDDDVPIFVEIVGNVVCGKKNPEVET